MNGLTFAGMSVSRVRSSLPTCRAGHPTSTPTRLPRWGPRALAALLLPQIFPIFSVVAPCQSGAALRHLGKLLRTRNTSLGIRESQGSLMSSHRVNRREFLTLLAGSIAVPAKPFDTPLIVKLAPDGPFDSPLIVRLAQDGPFDSPLIVRLAQDRPFDSPLIVRLAQDGP